MPAKWRVLCLGLGLLNACAQVPSAPSVFVLPATGKPMDVFQAEDTECRAYAQHQVAVAATPRQSQYDIAYSQCMYAKGNVLPGIVAPAPRVPLPPPGAPPPPPSSPPALPPPATPPRSMLWPPGGDGPLHRGARSVWAKGRGIRASPSAAGAVPASVPAVAAC